MSNDKPQCFPPIYFSCGLNWLYFDASKLCVLKPIAHSSPRPIRFSFIHLIDSSYFAMTSTAIKKRCLLSNSTISLISCVCEIFGCAFGFFWNSRRKQFLLFLSSILCPLETFAAAVQFFFLLSCYSLSKRNPIFPLSLLILRWNFVFPFLKIKHDNKNPYWRKEYTIIATWLTLLF